MANFNVLRLFLLLAVVLSLITSLTWNWTNQWLTQTAHHIAAANIINHAQKVISPTPSNNPQQQQPSASIINNCPSHQRTNYTVSFLSPSQHESARGDLYSGMWWQSIEAMLQTNFSRIGNLEAVAFVPFKKAKRVMQTVDWLDLSVEHLSKYVKHFQQGWGNDLGVEMRGRVEEILFRYIYRSKQSCHHGAPSLSDSTQSAIPSTVAILPIHISSKSAGTDQSRLTMLQLAATIASLWNAGVPRVVVAGIANNGKAVAQEAFELLIEHLKIRPMELAYVPMDDEGEKLVPKVAMIRFQNAIREYATMNKEGREKNYNSTRYDNESTSLWLGTNPSRWQYIYFTEPDLILHIRPEAVSSLSNELQKDHLLNAHRLQPLPHIQQFMDIYESTTTANTSKMESLLLPNLANFAAIHNLDTSTGDTCCDQGKFYPSNVDSPSKHVAVRKSGKCTTEWVFCGFSRKNNGNYRDWSYILEKHKLLVTYPFISLERGTGLPFVHHGQHVCIPKRGSMASC